MVTVIAKHLFPSRWHLTHSRVTKKRAVRCVGFVPSDRSTHPVASGFSKVAQPYLAKGRITFGCPNSRRWNSYCVDRTKFSNKSESQLERHKTNSTRVADFLYEFQYFIGARVYVPHDRKVMGCVRNEFGNIPKRLVAIAHSKLLK